MTTALMETLVRPFVTGQTAPPRVLPFATPTRVPANIKLRIGRGGGVKTFAGSFNFSQTYYVIKYPREMNVFEQAIADISGVMKANMQFWSDFVHNNGT